MTLGARYRQSWPHTPPQSRWAPLCRPLSSSWLPCSMLLKYEKFGVYSDASKVGKEAVRAHEPFRVFSSSVSSLRFKPGTVNEHGQVQCSQCSVFPFLQVDETRNASWRSWAGSWLTKSSSRRSEASVHALQPERQSPPGRHPRELISSYSPASDAPGALPKLSPSHAGKAKGRCSLPKDVPIRPVSRSERL